MLERIELAQKWVKAMLAGAVATAVVLLGCLWGALPEMLSPVALATGLFTAGAATRAVMLVRSLKV